MNLHRSNIQRVMALLSLALLVTGCCTMMHNMCGPIVVYGGTRTDAGMLSSLISEGIGLTDPQPIKGDTLDPGTRAVVFGAVLLDFPLSFIADTITLPYVVYRLLEDPIQPQKPQAEVKPEQNPDNK